jgi:hypothetical protein
MGENVPNGHKICQMTGKLTEWTYVKYTNIIARPTKVYTNWDFWFEKEPSGNPD